jgi:hypothetical protein
MYVVLMPLFFFAAFVVFVAAVVAAVHENPETFNLPLPEVPHGYNSPENASPPTRYPNKSQPRQASNALKKGSIETRCMRVQKNTNAAIKKIKSAGNFS